MYATPCLVHGCAVRSMIAMPHACAAFDLQHLQKSGRIRTVGADADRVNETVAVHNSLILASCVPSYCSRDRSSLMSG